MQTEVIRVTGNKENDREAMAKAGRIIRKGGLVAIPTETVYGLAGDALNPVSASKIYRAKGRPSDNPLIVHIAKREALKEIVREIPDAAVLLADRFWPGPLTMIFRKNEKVPYETTGGLETVAVRMPSHPVSLEFIRAAGGFIAAPSANRSGRPSCTTAAHVKEDLDGKIELILDGGPVGIGLESTIIDLTEKTPCLLRPGYIDLKMLREILGEVAVDPAIEVGLSQEVHPKAPGMKYRHYAPKGELTIVKGAPEKVAACINGLTQRDEEAGKRAAVITSTENAGRYHCSIVFPVGSEKDEEEIARNLFSVLRRADEVKADVIYSEAFNDTGIGMAIMNRLGKAAGHKIIETD